ncbi:hypothetical protein H8S90_10025 [Olivibacter sp. SDN3]|uniref:hypothetical protein n=1 Tax=Olivibacter sp. SDN3 TaxID=2764720 RepID=UPI001650DF2D|nr:hypothetical protein [Olivibacter sp. SDN3]QNL51879.1 hypothetical protein H8S90_10025 [Olivibacter sp. SDN3]
MKIIKELPLSSLRVRSTKSKNQFEENLLDTSIGTDSKNICIYPYLKIYRLLMLSVFSLLTLVASAQKSTVLDVFSKNGIDADILTVDVKQPEGYAYEFKQTVVTADKSTITLASYDPSKPEAERWIVNSVDGKSPSKSAVKSFIKNRKEQSEKPQPDDASYKVEKENTDQLVISFKLDPNTVTKDASFLKDCRTYLTINLKNKQLEYSEVLNEKPVKVKILNVDKLNKTTKYNWDDKAKQYFTVSDELNMFAKFVGQEVKVQTLSEYSNFIAR